MPPQSATKPAGTSKAIVSNRFYGKLEMELQPDLVHVYQRVFSAGAVKVRFDPAIDAKAEISVGELSDQRKAAGVTEAFLVEPPGTDPFVATDLDANGTIDARERFPLKPTPPNGFASIIRLPIANPFFKSFPVLFHYVRGFKHPNLKPGDRLVFQSIMTLAYGNVDISGRKVLFQYPFDPQSPAMSTTEGLFGIDVDGDGRIRDEQFSPESSYATETELVFRYGNIFLSTERIDLAKNEIVVRQRASEEYLRHEIEVGKQMPDFSFVDFEGKKRRLYEFKGKYVLLDFWGVWCVDCREETPYHVEAFKRFRSRGLEILSLNTDENIETAKAYLAKNKMTWTQATNDSIRRLVEVTYRIQEYPSTLLIGPDAKVLVFNQKQLRGEHLLETLDRILPK